MNHKNFLFHVIILSVVLFSVSLNTLMVSAQSTTTNLKVISPDNVKNLELLSFEGQGAYSGAFALRPQGDLIAAVTTSGITLLDQKQSRQSGFIPIGLPATALAISPDGETLAVLYNSPVKQTDKDVETALMEGLNYEPHITFYALPDGKPTGDEIKDLGLCGSANIWQMAFTPDGTSLIFEKIYTRTQTPKLICQLSIESGEIRNTYELPENSESTLSPDGKFAAILQLDEDHQTDQATILDTLTFKPMAEIKFPLVSWPEISFTQQGDFVLRAYEGEVEGSSHLIRIWSLPDALPVVTLQEDEHYSTGDNAGEYYDRIMSVDLSANQKWVATGSQNGKIKLWNAVTGKMEKELGTLTWVSTNLVANGGDLTATMNSYVGSLVFSSDGQNLVAAENRTTLGQNGQIHVYSIPNGIETASFYGLNTIEEDPAMAFSPDSSSLAVGGLINGCVEIYPVGNSKPVLNLSGHSAVVNDVQYSADGALIATASDDATIRLWDARSGKTLNVLKGHTARVNRIGFSPDGKWLVSASDDGTLRRWSLQDGSLINTLSLEGKNWRFKFLAALPDNRSVVYTALQYPSPLSGYITRQILWDVESGKETPIGGGKVTITMLLPDGRTFVGYSDNGKVLGTLETNGRMILKETTIRSPYGTGALIAPVLTPDGRLLISGNGFGQHAWQISADSVNFLGIIAAEEPVPAYGSRYEISPDGKILAFAGGGVIYLMGVPG